jgi:hypothetical protein
MEHSGHKLYPELFTNCPMTRKPTTEGTKEDSWVTSLACGKERAGSYNNRNCLFTDFHGRPDWEWRYTGTRLHSASPPPPPRVLSWNLLSPWKRSNKKKRMTCNFRYRMRTKLSVLFYVFFTFLPYSILILSKFYLFTNWRTSELS